MFKVNDHQTGRLFDPWKYLGPKRRKLLETSWAGVFRTYLLNKLPVKKIAKYFDNHMGRPTKDIYTAMGALILQQLHDLSDRDVMDALAFNIQWHYALDITDDSDNGSYLCERTLRTYRRIFIEEGLDTVLFETMTDTLIAAFHVDTSKQRIDSTLIRSNMRKLGRIGLFAATITKFLKALRRKHHKLFNDLIEPEFRKRYLDKEPNGCFSKVKPSEASRTLQELGEDLLYLVELFSSYDRVKKLHEYRLLERVLSEQCRVTGSGNDKRVTIKKPKKIASDCLQNPSDPDATYDGYKGQGYQAQVMETYQEEKHDDKPPDLITYIDIQPAHEPDEDAVQPAIDTTQERECGPEELQGDTLYGSDDNVQNASVKGVTLIAPVKGPTKSPSNGLEKFEFDTDTSFVTRCPEGHKPYSVKRTPKQRIIARFTKESCSACSRLGTCPISLDKRAAYLRYTDKQVRLAQRRAYEETKEFLDKHRWRAGIEATNSHLKSDVGAGRLRVRGMPNVRFAIALKALGLNILRCAKAMTAFTWSQLCQIQTIIMPKLAFITVRYLIFYRYLSKNKYLCLFGY